MKIIHTIKISIGREKLPDGRGVWVAIINYGKLEVATQAPTIGKLMKGIGDCLVLNTEVADEWEART